MKLLVIDGQPLMALGLRTLFSAVPETKIIDTMFGQNAVALYRQHTPDVVILDMHLPDSYGPDVARDIRTFDDKAKLVFLTNDYKPLAAFDAAQAGAHGFLSKSASAQTRSPDCKGLGSTCCECQADFEKGWLYLGTTCVAPWGAMKDFV